ncbi:hypothetical protein ILYODFUR_021987 [Ilyodon furcidens]|uniref:Uncharacterized protein n=1 Tax=Ilyodon furcidens TaxID=33524 RepID=A0ABV0VFZ9_9TELE
MLASLLLPPPIDSLKGARGNMSFPVLRHWREVTERLAPFVYTQKHKLSGGICSVLLSVFFFSSFFSQQQQTQQQSANAADAADLSEYLLEVLLVLLADPS